MTAMSAVEIHRAERFMAKVREFIDSSLFEVEWSPRTALRQTFGFTLEQAQEHARMALALVVEDMTEPFPRRLTEPAYELLEWCFDEVEETLCPGSVMTPERWERPAPVPWSPFTGPTLGTMVSEGQRIRARALRENGPSAGVISVALLDRCSPEIDRLALCTPQGTQSTLDTSDRIAGEP